MANETVLPFPFGLDGNGNITITSDQSRIWNDRVKSAITTRVGERVMRPTYGTAIDSALFNTIGSMQEIVLKEVNRVFHQLLPLLSLEEVLSDYDEKTNQLTMEIRYKLPNNTLSTTQVGIVTVSNTNPIYEELA